MEKDRVSDMNEISVELITPESAREYLNRSIGNRPIRKGKVIGYASDMTREKWLCEPGIEAIQISKEGQLMNGHHRLMAVIECGLNIEFRVETGVDKGVMDFIDRNAPRSVGDIMSISYGWTSARNRVATVNSIHRYGSGKRQSWRALTISETVLFGDRYGEYMDAIGNHHKSPITAAMVAVFVRALRDGEDLDGILAFIDVLKTGLPVDGWECSGALLLVRFAMERTKRASHGGAAGMQITGQTERALRALLDGERLRLLRPYKRRIWPTPVAEHVQ